MNIAPHRSSLPLLAGELSHRDGRPDAYLLRSLQRCRQQLHQKWCLANPGHEQQAAQAADQFLGLDLLLGFIRARQITAAPELAEFLAAQEGWTLR